MSRIRAYPTIDHKLEAVERVHASMTGKQAHVLAALIERTLGSEPVLSAYENDILNFARYIATVNGGRYLK